MVRRTAACLLASVLGFAGAAGGCSDWEWSQLYGKECNGELIESGADCLIEVCGDGIVSPGEECDDSNERDDDGCLSNCREGVCGDGQLFGAVEDCDDGNLEPGDGCNERCRKEDRCGDGEVSGPELCDDGNLEAGDGCSPSCLFEPDPVLCGNGELDENEICDDENEDNDDGCLSSCSRSSCGDGLRRRGVEDCEDGNERNGDGCTRNCIVCEGEGTRHRIGNDHCYVLHSEAVPFEEARDICAREGAYLWTPTSGGETREITRNVISLDTEAWIGLYREGDEDHRWITGETAGYRAWVEGSPTARDCVAQFGVTDNETNFISRYCGNNRVFVCEHEPAHIDPDSHVAYRRFFVPRTFQDAAADCAERGGEMLGLESLSERDFVRDEMKNDAWLGVTRLLSGEFEWLSGELVSDEFLEGADLSGTGDCLSYSSGSLRVNACDEEIPVICEFH